MYFVQIATDLDESHKLIVFMMVLTILVFKGALAPIDKVWGITSSSESHRYSKWCDFRVSFGLNKVFYFDQNR
jgi:hypothetical protein